MPDSFGFPAGFYVVDGSDFEKAGDGEDTSVVLAVDLPGPDGEALSTRIELKGRKQGRDLLFTPDSRRALQSLGALAAVIG